MRAEQSPRQSDDEQDERVSHAEVDLPIGAVPQTPNVTT
jgi:hypothetical protein